MAKRSGGKTKRTGGRRAKRSTAGSRGRSGRGNNSGANDERSGGRRRRRGTASGGRSRTGGRGR